MSLVNKTFAVNVTPGAMPPIVHVSEYDVGRAYTVSILDEQGNTFTIPTGTTASIEGTLNGSVGFTQSATVSNNQVSFTLSESMTAYSGKAWCKIKLTQNSQPIQTCAFVLAVDRAGVEAGTISGASGFEDQITDAVEDWLDTHGGGIIPSGGQSGQALVSNGQGGAVWGVKPFQLPSGGQSGQALISDGANGAFWGAAQGGGSGLTDEAKQALLACFENVAWINDQGQTYYDALEDALYPPANLVSISAVFTQGSAVIYDTDSLNTLKQYLTVTAHYDNSTTQTVTNYTLSGTLTVGTSTITVLYGGKSTTFNVTVSAAKSDMDGWADGVPYTDLAIIEGSYYETNGTITTYNGWSRTDYVPCDGASSITFPKPIGISSPQYNVFVTAEKEFIRNFIVSNSDKETTVTVPNNAAYFGISGGTAALQNWIASGIVPHA